MCVSSLVIQHAMGMCLLSSVVCLALQYLSALSYKGHDFLRNVTERKICVLTFSTTVVWNISHSKKHSASLHAKYPLQLTDHNDTWIFKKDFWNLLKHKVSWKSIKWDQSFSMHTDGWTDRHVEANIGFSQFGECTCFLIKPIIEWHTI